MLRAGVWDAPCGLLVLGVDDDAPTEGPSTLRIVEPYVGAPRRAAIGRREFLHGKDALLIGVAAMAIPTADQAHIAENRLLQASEPFESHPQASYGYLYRSTAATVIGATHYGLSAIIVAHL